MRKSCKTAEKVQKIWEKARKVVRNHQIVEKIASEVEQKSKKNWKNCKYALNNYKVKSWIIAKKLIKKWKFVSKVIWKVEKRCKKFETCWKVDKSAKKLKKMQTISEKAKKVEKNEKKPQKV